MVKIVDQKVDCAQSYGAKGLAEIWLKIDFLAGSNSELSESIQHIMLKLTVGKCLKRDYVRTKFCQNP